MDHSQGVAGYDIVEGDSKALEGCEARAGDESRVVDGGESVVLARLSVSPSLETMRPAKSEVFKAVFLHAAAPVPTLSVSFGEFTTSPGSVLKVRFAN